MGCLRLVFILGNKASVEWIPRFLMYDNFPSLQRLVLNGSSCLFFSRVAITPHAIHQSMHDPHSSSQEADSDSDSSNAVESMSFEYSINGVFYDVTLQRDVEENEVVVDYERTEGSFLAFGEEHERDITRTFMFNDTPYTVSIDAAATVYQLKNKAILVAVFLLGDV